MTEVDIQARLEAARLEFDPISSEVQRLTSAHGLYTPERRKALRRALAQHNAALDAYSQVLAEYYDLLLNEKASESSD